MISDFVFHRLIFDLVEVPVVLDTNELDWSGKSLWIEGNSTSLEKCHEVVSHLKFGLEGVDAFVQKLFSMHLEESLDHDCGCEIVLGHNVAVILPTLKVDRIKVHQLTFLLQSRIDWTVVFESLREEVLISDLLQDPEGHMFEELNLVVAEFGRYLVEEHLR